MSRALLVLGGAALGLLVGWWVLRMLPIPSDSMASLPPEKRPSESEEPEGSVTISPVAAATPGNAMARVRQGGTGALISPIPALTSPGDSAASRLSFSDGFLAAGKTLSDFDPALSKVVFTNQRAIFASDGIQRCGTARAARRGGGWALQSPAAIDARVENGHVSFGSLSFAEPDEDIAGDQEFQSCFAKELSAVRLECTPCRNGHVTFPWPLGLAFKSPPSSPPQGGTNAISPPGQEK